MSVYSEFVIAGTERVPATGLLDIPVVDVESPQDGSSMGRSGPGKQPGRPYLELCASPTGVAARVVRGDGEVQPVAVWVGKDGHRAVSLPESPLAVAARSDGLWALYRDRLVSHDLDGKQQRSVDITGNCLVASTSNDVWVTSLDQAWYVDAGGDTRGPYPWSGGPSSIGSGDRLCALAEQSPRPVRCLTPEGEESEITLSSSPRPLERLLALSDHGAVVGGGEGSTALTWYDRDAAPVELAVHGVGLTASGRGFVATHRDGAGVDLLVEGDPWRPIALPARLAMTAPVRVVAVDGERVLVRDVDHASWLDGDQVERSVTLDEAAYRDEIVAHGWTVAPAGALAAIPAGPVLVSATGPEGMAIIGVARRG